MTWLWRSVGGKLLLVLLIFVAVPVIVAQQFQAAEQQRKSILLKALQDQGHLVALSVLPLLENYRPQALPELNRQVARMGSDRMRLKVLFQPTGAAAGGFFFVAVAPQVGAPYLDRDLQELIDTGVVDDVGATCSDSRQLAIRYRNPAGEAELMTSASPVRTPAGCWLVITSQTASDVVGSAILRPFWQEPEIRVAAAIYIVMAVLVLLLLLGLWGSLRRFAERAREVRAGVGGDAPFAATNRIPELNSVAAEFDRLVAAMRDSARALRNAAEENAHAFKTPLATIAQAVEPLRRAIAADDARAQRALEVIERSVTRLDSLVTAARRMDETIAELMNPPRHRVDLSRMIEHMMRTYGKQTDPGQPQVRMTVEPGLFVYASEDLLETVVENLLENAFSFSPAGTAVEVSLKRRRGQAVLAVEDRGPGVQPENLELIFDRYFTLRPNNGTGHGAPGNQGLGLWVVRRNAEATGGTVKAANRPGGGLSVEVTMPLAR